jgi:hypothetical protein
MLSAVQKASYYWRTYSLSGEDFDTLWGMQHGTCAIGGEELDGHATGSQDRVEIDHAHYRHIECAGPKSCRECVRGIVCGRHNKMVSHYERHRDRYTADEWQRGQDYLARHAVAA